MRRSTGTHDHEIARRHAHRHVVEEGARRVSRGERRGQRRGGVATAVVIEAAALVHDAELGVVAEQLDHRTR